MVFGQPFVLPVGFENLGSRSDGGRGWKPLPLCRLNCHSGLDPESRVKSLGAVFWMPVFKGMTGWLYFHRMYCETSSIYFE